MLFDLDVTFDTIDPDLLRNRLEYYLVFILVFLTWSEIRPNPTFKMENIWYGLKAEHQTIFCQCVGSHKGSFLDLCCSIFLCSHCLISLILLPNNYGSIDSLGWYIKHISSWMVEIFSPVKQEQNWSHCFRRRGDLKSTLISTLCNLNVKIKTKLWLCPHFNWI